MTRRDLRQHAGGEPRSVLLALTLCVSLATGVALLAAGSAVSDGRAEVTLSGPATANAELVRAFYATVNDAIRTGDADALDALVAPGFAWCRPCPGQAPTLEDFRRHLAGLRRMAPEARLAVEDVVADTEGTVTARVHVTGYPLVGEPAPWGPVDTFRLAGGLIAERRSGPNGVALVESLLGARLDALPPAVTGVALARLTFPIGSEVAGLLSAGPTLVVVESGSLGVRTASGGRVLRAGDGAADNGTTAGRSPGLAAVLRQGDAVVIPAGVRHALTQQGAEPAAALGVTLFFVDDGSDRSASRRPEFMPFVAPEGIVPGSLPPGPAVRLLASGTVGAWPTGPVRVAVGRAVLGPGARLVPPAGESVLLAIEAGMLGVVDGEERTVAAGTGVVRPAGSVREIRNAGGGQLVLLVLTVAGVAE